MRIKICFLLGTLSLTSCTTSDDDRYRDLDLLERPPIVASENKTTATIEADTSVVKEKVSDLGLGEDVYLSTSTPPELILKRPLETAWNVIGRALKQADIKVTDLERNKGFYYVAFKSKSLLDQANSLLSIFQSEDKGDPYLITVVAEGEQTKVTAALTNAPETSKSQETANAPIDDSQKLLELLYETLQNDLKE